MNQARCGHTIESPSPNPSEDSGSFSLFPTFYFMFHIGDNVYFKCGGRDDSSYYYALFRLLCMCVVLFCLCLGCYACVFML